MKKYTFGVWLDIDAEDEDQALSLFNDDALSLFDVIISSQQQLR